MNAKTLLFVGLIGVVAVVVLLLLSQPTAEPPEPQPPVPLEPELAHEDSPFGFIQGADGFVPSGPGYERDYTELMNLGVHWDRPHAFTSGAFWEEIEPAKGEYDFSRLDSTVQESLEAGVNPLMPLGPINPLYESTAESPYPNDIEAFGEFVRATVERYDADGMDDAPGSPFVKYWFVGWNEADDTVQPPSVYWQENPDQFIEIHRISCEKIKEACPDCRAVMSGALHPLLSFSYVGEVVEMPGGSVTMEEDGFYTRILAGLGDECGDMVIDYHLWPPPWDYQDHNKVIEKIQRIRPDAEIWTTEGGTFSDLEGITEAEQAAAVVKLYTYPMAHGQDKLFWSRIIEFPWPGESIFDYTGLMHNPENDREKEETPKDHKKLSYYTYKLVVEKLEGSDWDNLETIQESGDVYIYKSIRRGDPIWTAWNDGAQEQAVTLQVGNVDSVRITETVPHFSDGLVLQTSGEQYPDFFDTEVMQVVNGAVTLHLGENPVFIEVAA